MLFFKKSDCEDTLIGFETEIKGSLQSNSLVRINGKFQSEMRAETVIIEEQGRVVGNISANRVVVGGELVGDVIAETSLELLSTARILGDIQTSSLIVALGGQFQGNCHMNGSQKNGKEFTAKPPQDALYRHTA